MNGTGGIIEILPVYAIYGFYAAVAFVAAMIFLSFWRNISPAAPGVPLGYYEIVGRIGSGFHKRIQGTLVDATSLFLNPETEPKFKKFILENLKEKGGSEAKTLAALLEKWSLDRLCRVVVTRDRFWTKHAILQWGYVDKPITELGTREMGEKETGWKFSFSAGIVSKGMITGRMYTLPEPIILPKVGRVKIHGKFNVHIFLPDAGRGDTFTPPPEWLGKLVLYIPSIVEMNELLESKDEIIKDLRRMVGEVGEEVSRAATRRDAAVKALKGLTMEQGGPEEEEELGVEDIAIIGGPAAIAAYIAHYLGYEWIYGAIAGLVLGYFLYRRRRRR